MINSTSILNGLFVQTVQRVFELLKVYQNGPECLSSGAQF